MISYNKIAGQRLQRIEALSDGVFAIAMTILVFNLKDPVSEAVVSERELLQSLSGILPTLLTYFLSFMTLGIFWTGHSAQFIFIERSDRNLNWISIFFLMFASILPFTTGILSNHITHKVSVGLYWLNIMAMGLLLYIHWNYASRMNYLSVQGKEARAIDRAVRRRIMYAQSLYAAGALLCFVNTYLSILVIIAIQLNYAFAIFTDKPEKPK